MADKNQQIVTPVGTAYYAHLFKPAVFEGKTGDYEINVVFPESYTEKLKGMIDKVLAQAKESPEFKGKKFTRPLLGYQEKDEDDEVFKGATVFKFKMKPEGTNRKTGETFKRKVAVFDASKALVKDLNIGNGTTVKICAIVAPYYTSSTVHGVGLYMEAVQIINLVEWTGEKSADSYGFEEEDGFIAGSTFDDETGADGADEDCDF